MLTPLNDCLQNLQAPIEVALKSGKDILLDGSVMPREVLGNNVVVDNVSCEEGVRSRWRTRGG
jgi:hypothetical protein